METHGTVLAVAVTYIGYLHVCAVPQGKMGRHAYLVFTWPLLAPLYKSMMQYYYIIDMTRA